MMQHAIAQLEKINTKLGEWVSWLTLLMVLTMCANVLLRYLAQATLIWQQELVGFMHAMVFLIAAGYTFTCDKHVRVDVFYHRFSVRTRATIQLIGSLIFLLPMCVAIGYYSTEFIINSWHISEASAEYNGIKGIFILKSCIWLFCATLSLQAVATILQSLQTLSQNKSCS